MLHTISMSTVTFLMDGEETVIEAEAGKTLLALGLEHGLPIEHACGGNGFCTTCLCTVHSGMEYLSPRSDREENMGIVGDDTRLGCQAKVLGTGDVTVTVESL